MQIATNSDRVMGMCARARVELETKWTMSYELRETTKCASPNFVRLKSKLSKNERYYGPGREYAQQL